MLKGLMSISGFVLICAVSYAQESGIRAEYYVDGAVEKFHNRSHTSLESIKQGSSVVYSTNGAELILTSMRMNKTSGGVNNPDHRKTGLNSVLVADGGSDVLLQNCDLISHTAQADGITVSGEGTKLRLQEGSVTMSRVGSSAVNAVYGGLVDIVKTEVNTQANQSPSFYTYNGGNMDIKEAFGTSAGQASPLFSSSAHGIIHATECRFSAAKWTIGYVDGGIMSLYDSDLKAGGFCGFLLYGADNNEGQGMLTLVKNTVSVSEGPVFLVTNTRATVNVSGNKISCKDNELMSVRADDWGVKGSNGGHASLYVEKQSLNGDIYVDNISSLYLELKKGGNLNGQINARENRCADVRVRIEAGSSWTSKGESYLTSIVFGQPIEKGIRQLKGNHTIYYDPTDPDNAPLGGREYKTGGGKLVPLK